MKYPSGELSWIFASDFLDDTTKSNPTIREWRNVPEEWTTFYLKVEDAAGNIQYDSVRITQSWYSIRAIYILPRTIQRGDSVRFFGDSYFISNFPPLTYIITPTHGLSDPTDIYGWAKPDTSITYYLEAVDSAGCRSNKIEYWHIEVVDTATVSNSILKTQKDIEIFPNPASDKITIYSHSSRIIEVEIYDLTGICLYRSLNIVSNRIDLETDKLPKGMYILKVRVEQDKISRKIVIQ